MEFSNSVELGVINGTSSVLCCRLSPDGMQLAHCNAGSDSVLIRERETLKVIRTYSFSEQPIQRLDWSPDSQLVLCLPTKNTCVLVFAVADNWSAKIEGGKHGIAHAQFSPDSNHVLVSSELQLSQSIWNVQNGKCRYIHAPKHTNCGVEFSKDGAFLAVLERVDCRDQIAVYYTNSWELYCRFQVDTFDAANIAWLADDSALCVYDTAVEYKVLKYDLRDGKARGTFTPDNKSQQLGVKTFHAAPNVSSFLVAIGGYDNRIRLLNSDTWQQAAERTHPSLIKRNTSAVYQLVRADSTSVSYVLEGKRPWKLSGGGGSLHGRVMSEAASPKIGVSLLQFSSDGAFLASCVESAPQTVVVWDTCDMSPAAVLVQDEPVRELAWDPQAPRLALVGGSGVLSIWSPAGAAAVLVPLQAFRATHVRWTSDGAALLLLDRDKFCCCYLATTTANE